MNPQQKSDDPIKHVILLMFENHSFDQMLGSLKQIYPGLNGVDTANPGKNKDSAGTDYIQAPTIERQMLLDPHHEVNHVATQMENDNSGFVKDFEASFIGKCTPEHKKFVMGYYPLDFLPALHGLAREFMICDQWYSSLPGPTWPNRFF